MQGNAAQGPAGKWQALPREDKVLYTNTLLAGSILAWGLATWDYGSRSPHASDEGWFQQDTQEGGADKLGHMYGTYVASRSLAWLFGTWGYTTEQAARYGALSALGLQSLVEAGDSFSKFGFSWQDMVMNTLGAGAGYLLSTHPDLANKVDLRIEYVPNAFDIFTDYEHQKYLMAVKLDGFDALRDTPAGWLELHLGYYARGYEKSDPQFASRNVYFGIALNLSRLFDENEHKHIGTFLRYYQPPRTYIEFDRQLSKD